MDWHKPLIGHLQHHLRDPNRDHGPRPHLSHDLRRPCRCSSPRRSTASRSRSCSICSRSRRTTSASARRSSSAHATPPQVIAAVEKWVAGARQERRGLRAPRARGALGAPVAQRGRSRRCSSACSQSPEPRARAQAVRVLCYWRDRVPDALALLKPAAEDENPRVRLEAVRAASFFNGKDVPEAFDRRLRHALKQPSRLLPRLHASRRRSSSSRA